MDNEQLVLSFMELTNLPIEDAKRYLTAAGNILEVAIQNYYESHGDSQPAPEEPANSQQYEDEYEDEVRAPLPREYSQLIEEESVRSVQLNRVKRQFSSSFRDLKKETEIQENLARGIAPKRKCLEDIYRNPIDITANMDFYSAKYFGQKQGKWIALLINDESFLSLSFNRDIFNTDLRQRVKQLIKKSFVFLRKNSSCEESIKILQNYKLTEQSIPIFLIIDSLTGELRKNFGDTKNVTLKSVVHELKKYTSSENKDLKYVSLVASSFSFMIHNSFFFRALMVLKTQMTTSTTQYPTLVQLRATFRHYQAHPATARNQMKNRTLRKVSLR